MNIQAFRVLFGVMRRRTPSADKQRWGKMAKAYLGVLHSYDAVATCTPFDFVLCQM